MIYHSSDCLSDWNQSELIGSDWKLVRINSEWSNWNPVRQIEQIPYYLDGTVFQNFWFDSEQFWLILLRKKWGADKTSLASP